MSLFLRLCHFISGGGFLHGNVVRCWYCFRNCFALPAASVHRLMTEEVKIDNFKFGPEALTIPVGSTVTWTNRDDIPHTVVSTNGAFKSKVLDTDEKFSFTFAKAGSYEYFCSIYLKMTGKVIVQ